MEWLKEYWWLILVVLIGTVISAIKDLSKVDHTRYLNRPKMQQKPTEKKEDDSV